MEMAQLRGMDEMRKPTWVPYMGKDQEGETDRVMALRRARRSKANRGFVAATIVLTALVAAGLALWFGGAFG